VPRLAQQGIDRRDLGVRRKEPRADVGGRRLRRQLQRPEAPEPLGVVAVLSVRHAAGVQPPPGRRVEADALGDPRQQGEHGAAHRPLRHVRRRHGPLLARPLSLPTPQQL
jgi:hypothetical protein